MFDSLKKLFKKETPVKKQTEITFSKLKAYFYKNIEEKKASVINESNSIKNQTSSMVKEAISIVNEMKNREIEEKRAKSSEQIKNRFCEKSSLLLSSIIENEPAEIKDFEDMEKYFNYMKKYLAKIDLSPKEVMHIKFFFSEDLSKLGKKINEISINTEKIHTILNSSFMVQKKSLEDLFIKTDIYEKNLETWKKQLDSLSNELITLENNKRAINFIDLSEFSSIRPDIKKIETRVSYLKQQISSEFGAFSKILKRIYHKEKDSFIENYIENPFEAFMEDSQNNVRSLLLKTIIMIKDGKIEVDKKIIGKLEDLTEKLDELSQYRKEVYDLESKSKSLKEKEQILTENEQLNRKYEKDIESINRSIENSKRIQLTIENDIEKTQQNIEKNKLKSVESASALFDEDFVLVI
ncbi:MAG: hypothetical protein HY831_04375 [Candidatus Aenigmarchaeota archaeon]|nr:hypothetical protein [Candidatus Aenigmarchaeota archaeon]